VVVRAIIGLRISYLLKAISSSWETASGRWPLRTYSHGARPTTNGKLERQLATSIADKGEPNMADPSTGLSRRGRKHTCRGHTGKKQAG
jgi:hypothetical protein